MLTPSSGVGFTPTRKLGQISGGEGLIYEIGTRHSGDSKEDARPCVCISVGPAPRHQPRVFRPLRGFEETIECAELRR